LASTKALVLAGGYGSRLRPLTYTRPKPMLPLAGKPILEHIVEYLVKNSFSDIIVTTNYLCEEIKDYFGDGSRLGARMEIVAEEEPLGTAGSVRNVGQEIDDTFVVIQGDNITEIDFKKVLGFHRRKNGIATLALTPVEKPSEYGIAQVDREDVISRFIEKPKPSECFSNLANTGLYVLEPEVLDYVPTDQPCDFSRDLFPRLMQAGQRLFGYRTSDFWIDIGCLENYVRANRWALKKLRKSQIAESAEVDGTGIKGPVVIGENAQIHGKLYGPAIFGKNSSIEAGTIVKPNSVVSPNVRIGHGSKIVGSIIYEETQIANFARLDHCVIGEQCVIGSGVSVGHGTIIGPSCRIGEAARVLPGTKIWPKLEVSVKSRVRGILRSIG